MIEVEIHKEGWADPIIAAKGAAWRIEEEGIYDIEIEDDDDFISVKFDIHFCEITSISCRDCTRSTAYSAGVSLRDCRNTGRYESAIRVMGDANLDYV